ncbi:hypothetical protein GJAV_G00090650 [Gymnothorax javanicus]|nr:hypothetical protein GJAV_G00090650 [Gymnothorax javanicus]
MSESMSDSVSVFQTQVASVLEVLLNVAVVEITKLFESRDVSGARANSKTSTVQEDLRTRAESALENLRKRIQRAGVQARDGEKWLCDGRRAIPTAEGAAVLLESGRTGNAPRAGSVKAEGRQSLAVEFQVANVQSTSLALTAPSPGPSWRIGDGVAVGLVDSLEEGAVEEQNALQCCEKSSPRQAPEDGQIAPLTPVEGQLEKPVPAGRGCRASGRPGGGSVTEAVFGAPWERPPDLQWRRGAGPAEREGRGGAAKGDAASPAAAHGQAALLLHCMRRRRLAAALPRPRLPALRQEVQAPEGSATPPAVPHWRAALQLQPLPQELRPPQEPAAARALPHRRAPSRLRPVRQELPTAPEPEEPPAFPHRREALRLWLLQQAVPCDAEPQETPGLSQGGPETKETLGAKGFSAVNQRIRRDVTASAISRKTRTRSSETREAATASEEDTAVEML